MRKLFLLLAPFYIHAQTCISHKIDTSLILSKQGYSVQSGSCASPDGSMQSVTSPPSGYAYLLANGYCYTLSPVQKNFTMCFTFVSTGTNINLNSGYSSSGCAFVSFSGFNLYTCSPSCTLVGSGLSFSGLTVGQCYTWCFSGNCIGGGGGTGFDHVCPYWQDITPVPIELISFDCYGGNNSVELTWTTATEINNKEFEVWRSVDGINYEVIQTVKAKNQPYTYKIQDNFPNSEANYYKLKQIDYNGSGKFFNIIYCEYYGTKVQVEYYNMLGQKIGEPKGAYIKKLINGEKIRFIREIKVN